MSDCPSWNLATTREMIAGLYGKEQLLLARQSLNSVIDRLNFAHFHFREAMRRWDQHLIDVKDYDPVEVVFGFGDQGFDNEHARRIHELGAHIHACVQSLHTIPDIMAHGIYYSLAINKMEPIAERGIAAKSVSGKLCLNPAHKRLNSLFTSMYSSGEFQYINALNNHGKHRSIVQTAIWADLTGQDKDPISLKFSDFTYDGAQYNRREIRSVLTCEYERISRSVVECGIELWNVLKQRTVASSAP